jgi:divalent metal cation (Fe/Co/Zn/Cd) transporter
MKNLLMSLFVGFVGLLIGITTLLDAIKTQQPTKITCAAFAMAIILGITITLARQAVKLRDKQKEI